MEAKVYYVGSLQSLSHQAPSGNKYLFIGPNVPTKVSDSRDIEFYSKKASFRVMVSEKEIGVPKEETDEPIEELEEGPETDESLSEPQEPEEKPKEKVSKSHKKAIKTKKKGGK